MRLIHIAAIAATAIAFSPHAEAQRVPSKSAFVAFAHGLAEVHADIQTVQRRAAGGNRRPTPGREGEGASPGTGGHPYEVENDAAAVSFCNTAGNDAGQAEMDANAGVIALGPPPDFASALFHFNSACMKARWAGNNLQSCLAATLAPPHGTYPGSDIPSILAKLTSVTTAAGCP